MKRKTNKLILVATKNGYPVYRTAFEEDGHYYVNWNKKTINVDNDIKNGRFHTKGI